MDLVLLRAGEFKALERESRSVPIGHDKKYILLTRALGHNFFIVRITKHQQY